MYAIPQKYIDAYNNKILVCNKPLPDEWIKHRDLIKKILMADRLYHYSDDRSSFRSGEAVLKELMELKDIAFENAETDAERDLLNRLQKYYCSVDFYEIFPETAHPTFTNKAEIVFTPIEEFIKQVGLDELQNKLDEINISRLALITLIEEVDSYLSSFIASGYARSGKYVFLHPAIIDYKILFKTDQYKDRIASKAVLIPMELHSKINLFLQDNKKALEVMGMYNRYCRGFLSNGEPSISVYFIRNQKVRSGCNIDFPEIHFRYGDKGFSCVLHSI